MESSNEESIEIDLSAYSTEAYDPGPGWKRVAWLVCSQVFFETWFPWPYSLKSAILRLFGASIGTGVVWKPQLKLKYPWFLSVGDHCWIGEQVWIDNLVSVKFGDQVVISQGAFLLTGNHDYTSRTFDLMTEPITIESGAWVAAKAIVCPGVSVGKMAVLSVGSIAKSDLEDGWVYSGQPAEKKRKREMKS